MNKHDWKDKAAGKIASIGILLQTKFAVVMDKIMTSIPVGRQKLIVILFCFFTGGFSMYLIAKAIVTNPTPSLRIDSVYRPKHFDKTGDGAIKNQIDSSLYKRIQQYKRYMDSTKQAIRPSLMDSIKIVEEIYNNR